MACIKTDHADAWSLPSPSACAQLSACQALTWATDWLFCATEKWSDSHARANGPKVFSYGTVRPEAPSGSQSLSPAELSLLLAFLLFGRAKMGHFCREKEEDTAFALQFSCKILLSHCLTVPTLYFPTKWDLVSSAWEAPERRSLTHMRWNKQDFLCFRIGSREKTSPNALLPHPFYLKVFWHSRKNHTSNHCWRCWPDATGWPFTRLLNKCIQISHLGLGRGLWANQRV